MTTKVYPTILIILTGLVLLAHQALAQDNHEVEEAFKNIEELAKEYKKTQNENYESEEALNTLVEQAIEYDTDAILLHIEAMLILSKMYHKEKDFRAYNILLERAENGDGKAQQAIGNLYNMGGNDYRRKEKYYWYEKALKQNALIGGNIVGLGFYYLDKDNDNFDFERGKNLIIAGLAKGDVVVPEAASSFSKILAAGEVIEPNYVESYAWYNILVPSSKSHRFRTPKYLEGKLTGEEILQAQKLAKDYNYQYLQIPYEKRKADSFMHKISVFSVGFLTCITA